MHPTHRTGRARARASSLALVLPFLVASAFAGGSTTAAQAAPAAIQLSAPTQAVAGKAIRLRATAPGLVKPLFQFWVEAPDGTWSTGESGGAAIYSFTPASAGVYHVEAFAKASAQLGTVAPFAISAVKTIRVAGGTLVALGDSITFGYDLGATNVLPSPEAFPALIGEAGSYAVDNLGSPAWTSGDLLIALHTRLFRAVLAKASVVTVDIGNNDILQPAAAAGLLQVGAAGVPSPTLLTELGAAVKAFGTNLPAIVAVIRKSAPHARIVLYNLYNPIPAVAGPLATFAQTYIGQMNLVIAATATAAHLPVANAHAAFAGQQTTYVMLTNLHPTVAGQTALADLGDRLLGLTPVVQATSAP